MTPANDAALDAFIKLIAEKGFADVALRDVAEAAGAWPRRPLQGLSRQGGAGGSLHGEDRRRSFGRHAEPQRPRGDGARSSVRRHDAPLRRAPAVPRGPGRHPSRRHARSHARPGDRSGASPIDGRDVGSGLGPERRADGCAAAKRTFGDPLRGVAVYDKDETTDLSKTMAALDSRLKMAERWAQLFEKYVKSPEKRTRRTRRIRLLRELFVQRTKVLLTWCTASIN